MKSRELTRDFVRYWQKNIHLPPGARVVVACSGGIDSLALLDILEGLAGELDIHVAAAHFEHGIRGEASLADAAFVVDFCHQREIPCYIGHGDVLSEAAKTGESLETCARRLRYAFLWRVVRGENIQPAPSGSNAGVGDVSCSAVVNNAADLMREQAETYLATAHHADDQAETILMHILRGSGTHGLVGMVPQREMLIRPLLFASKADLKVHCEERSLVPRHDATNDIADCTRNKLRLELIPQLQAYNPAIREALCQLGELAGMDDDYLQEQVKEHYERLITVETADDFEDIRESEQIEMKNYDAVRAKQEPYHLRGSVAEILALHPALSTRLIQYMYGVLAGKQLSYVHIKACCELLERGRTGSKITLPGGFCFAISYKFFTLSKIGIPFSENNGKIVNVGESVKLQITPGEKIKLPDGSTLYAEILSVEDFFMQQCLPSLRDINATSADWDKCGGAIYLRHRQNGDRLKLEHGTRKLKDFLIDSHITRAKRDDLWLLTTAGDEILWLVGQRRTTVAQVADETKNVIKLKFEGE